MTIVIDASATLAWLYQENTEPGLFDLFRRVLREGGVVPTIWRYEIANSLSLFACFSATPSFSPRDMA